MFCMWVCAHSHWSQGDRVKGFRVKPLEFRAAGGSGATDFRAKGSKHCGSQQSS